MSAADVRRTRRPLVRSVLLATALAAVAAIAVPSSAASAGEAAAGYQVPLHAGSGVGTTSVVPAAASTSARAGRAANITVTYTGFSTAAKASFQRAVNIWKSRLTSGVTVKIAARYADLGSPSLLGSAGPTTVHRNFAGAPKQNVWYVAAAANKRAGSDLNGAGMAEIQANFNSAFTNWHFGSGAPPANKYDFETVVLHEIGHGVGLLSGIYQSGSSIRWDPLGGNVPLITGTFVVNSANKALTSFANGSAALKTAATSGQVFFNGPQAKAANGGAKPRVFAPNPFQPGSSLSHWDENTYGRGNANSLMTPFLSQGERILNPGAFTLGALKDSGW